MSNNIYKRFKAITITLVQLHSYKLYTVVEGIINTKTNEITELTPISFNEHQLNEYYDIVANKREIICFNDLYFLKFW